MNFLLLYAMGMWLIENRPDWFPDKEKAENEFKKRLIELSTTSITRLPPLQ